MRFEDRSHAGRLLGAALVERAAGARPIVLGLSYGGVLVGHQIARELGVELDMLLVPPPGAGRTAFRARKTPLNGRYAILVDDGAATGDTVVRAIDEVRRAGASRVVVALPVAPAFTATRLDELADEAVCLDAPAEFLAVAACYERFPEVTASEAVGALRAAG